jgi:metallophosphoesterase superfamily enzyme
MLKFIYNEPVAIWKEWVIISDLHLGADCNKRRPVDVGWRTMVEIVDGIMRGEGKKKLLVLGDVKASISSTSGDCGNFIREIGSKYELHITKGNHDGNIEKYKSYCKVHGPEGTVIDGLGALHGHAWPKPELLKCENIVIGHSHPKIVFGEERKIAQKVWMTGVLNEKGLREHYGKEVKINPRLKLTVFPCFCNSTPGGAGERTLGPLMKEDIFIKKSARIYLLNGIEMEVV